jgi:hypothetical protein
MSKFKIIIEYDGKQSSSIVKKEGIVSTAEIIGVLESTKISFVNDSVRKGEFYEKDKSKESGEKSN